MDLSEGLHYIVVLLLIDLLLLVESLGRANLIDVIPPTPEQIATICYTSV